MPRPDATAAFVAACQAQYVKPALFVEIHFTNGPVYVWSGRGPVSWGGNTYQGVGTFGTISSIEEGSNVQARGITLTLSGFSASLLSEILSDYQQGLPAIVSFGVFDAAGTLIPNPIISWAGATDQPTINVSGETASITIACENDLVAMNVAVENRYNDQTQKLYYPNDRGFEFVTAIQDLTIYWGRHPSSSNNFSVQ